MNLDHIADIFRDYWYLFIVAGAIVLCALIGYVLYVQYGVYLEPLIKSFTEKKTQALIDYNYTDAINVMKNKFNCTCTCAGG